MRNLLLFTIALLFGSTAFAQLSCSTVNASISLSASGGVVTLTNGSTPTATSNIYTTYYINWGDNTSSTAYSNSSLTHTYNTTGNYNVRLISTVFDSTNNITCGDTANASISVTTSLNCNNVNASIHSYNSTGNMGVVYNYSQLVSCPGLGVFYTLDWGDGTVGNANVGINNHNYSSAGTYTTTLYMTVIDSNNSVSCIDTATDTIVINGGNLNCNNVNALFTHSENGKTTTVVNSSTPNTGSGVSAQYIFSWGDGSTTTKSNKSSTIHTYVNNGTYFITLKAIYTTGSITCVDSMTDSVYINYTPPPPPNYISGSIILDSTNVTSNDSLIIWLITFDSSTNILKAVDSQQVHAYTSYYHFSNKAAGQYRTKAQLLNGQTSGTGYVPTYHDSALLWSNATIIAHNGGSSFGNNIYMKKGTVTSGPGFIGGNVTQGANKGTASGIEGLNILLTDASDNVITYAVTDAKGDYSFPNLPNATYKIYPEQVAYATTPAVITLTAGNYQYKGIDFERSMKNQTIQPKVTGITNINANNQGFKVYPNPASDLITINWDTQSQENATVIITDISGKVVAQSEVSMSKNTTINVAKLQPGLYFLTVSTERNNNTQKLIIK